MTDTTRLRTYDGMISGEAKSHDYPLWGFDLTWRNGAYYVSTPNLLKEGERLHVVPATALTVLEGNLRERITELEEALVEARSLCGTQSLLDHVHARLGLGVNIQTFSDTGDIEIRWKRDYDGQWSDERHVIAKDLATGLQAVLDHEDWADSEDEREADDA